MGLMSTACGSRPIMAFEKCAAGALSEPGSGDGPAGGFVVQAQDGQSGEVDDAGSGQDVGQDAFLAAAAGFSAAPGASGEVADLAFHDGTVLAVVLVFLAGFGVLQRGFMGVDADDPSPT